MPRLEREEFLTYPLIGLWALLGFQAGFINSFGFLACGRFVSHVTGFGTQIGMAIGASEFALALELIGFPLSFILGSAVSGFVTSARLERGLQPRYDQVTFFLPLALFLVTMAGYLGILGPFEKSSADFRSLGLLFGMSFLCGMQNGCFATLTKGQIRTTHLTGISTDIGTDMARLWFGKLNPMEHKLVRRANLSRLMTFLGFATGSIISVLATESYYYLALLVPVATSSFTFIVVTRISRAMNRGAVRTVRLPRTEIFVENPAS